MDLVKPAKIRQIRQIYNPPPPIQTQGPPQNQSSCKITAIWPFALPQLQAVPLTYGVKGILSSQNKTLISEQRSPSYNLQYLDKVLSR